MFSGDDEAPPARICCLDLDTFFVSVERILHPELVGRPVVVGGKRGARGVVLAASYEVRPYGVRSGIPLFEADRLAPKEAVFVPGTHGVYSEYAAKVRLIAQDFTPESRVASIDEMYLDFRGCEDMYRRPGDTDGDATIERVCREMTARIKRELDLPASCGIGSSKSIAKVASGIAKPAGVRLVRAGEEAAFLAPLPVRKLPGIGPVSEEKLSAIGVRTLGELAGMRVDDVKAIFGVRSADLILRARGVSAEETSGASGPRFASTIPRARRSAASRTSAPSRRTCATRATSRRGSWGSSSVCVGARASAA
jgi:DNA polymerase IV